MGENTTREPVTTCANCGGPMPTPAGRGRPALYCCGACRKAAFEARRTGQPGAFEVKVVDRQATVEHDLSECVTRVLASPTACRRVLRELARLAREDVLASDPKWVSTQAAARTLTDALYAPRRVQPRPWPAPLPSSNP